MDYATVLAQVQTLAATASDPTLSGTEVAQAISLARRQDAYGYDYYDTWATGTIYTSGEYRVPTVANGYAYQVTVAGTSHATTQPTWPTTVGATVTDGTVTWQNIGAYLWTPTYSLNRAVGHAWLMKAAKVAAEYEVSLGSGKNFKRDQVWKMCMNMAASYGVGGGASGSGGSSLGSVRLGSATARV